MGSKDFEDSSREDRAQLLPCDADDSHALLEAQNSTTGYSQGLHEAHTTHGPRDLIEGDKHDGGDNADQLFEKTLAQRKLENLRAWGKKEVWTGLGHECKATLRLASGLSMADMCWMFMQPMAIMFAGRLGAVELDAVALANSIFNVFGNSIAVSASFACDTFFSQTYGSSNRAFLGVQFQKSMIIFALMFMICLSIQLNVEHLLYFINIDPEVARLTGMYLETMVPGLLMTFMYSVLRKYIQVQNVVLIHILNSMIALGVHGIAQYLLVYHFGLGVFGSAIAQDIGIATMVLIYALYIPITGFHRETWSGVDSRCLLEWGPFLKLSFYSMLMTCLEWWAFEVTILVAGSRGVVELGVQTVIFNIDTIFFAVANGVTVATSVRIGQYLGAGNILAARRATMVGVMLTGVVCILSGVLCWTLRDYVPRLFTNVEVVLEATADLAPIIALFVVFDEFSSSIRRMLAGSGKQKVGFAAIAISYYLIGLPIGLYVWFEKPIGQKGLWLSLLLAVILSVMMGYAYMFYWVNWEDLAAEAKTRAMAGADASLIEDDKTQIHDSLALSHTPRGRFDSSSSSAITDHVTQRSGMIDGSRDDGGGGGGGETSRGCGSAETRALKIKPLDAGSTIPDMRDLEEEERNGLYPSTNVPDALLTPADEKTPLMASNNSSSSQRKGTVITRKIIVTRLTAIFVCSAICIIAICTNIFLPVTYDFPVDEFTNATHATNASGLTLML